MNPQHALAPFAAIAAALALSACGGGGSDSATTDDTATTPPVVSTNQFTVSGQWVVTPPTTAGASICYDLDTKTEVPDCSGAAWDLKLKSDGRTATMWTNSGVSGTGAGGAFGGPLDHTWADLLTWQNGTTDPDGGTLPASVFLADSAQSVFTGTNSIKSAAFEYAVTGADGDHFLYPTYRVFLVTTDSSLLDPVGGAAAPVYAMQVVGYYGTAGTTPSSSGTTSGIVTFRWADRADGSTRTATVDARSGWVYYDLVNNAVSTVDGTWHVAFNRYNLKLNGGESGSGTVAGFVGKTPAGFYGADGAVVVSRFTATTNVADTLADLTATDLAVPATASAWVKDSTTSPLITAATGSYTTYYDYGWYNYYPSTATAAAAGLAAAHMLKANDDRGTLIRTGEGTGYARLRLSTIAYATTSATSAQTWTIQFDLQPAP